MKILNQKGLTLIEILAAIVILMIVILGFLSFFSQAISHSRITEDKLTAINLAEKVLVQIKRHEPVELPHINENNPENFPKINQERYYYECKFINDLTKEEIKLGLYRIEVKIYDETKDTSLTKLYSYLTGKESQTCVQ